jgi:hypothetical protein
VTQREREKRERKWKVMRDIIFGEGQETISAIFKVHRQCPVVLVGQVMHMIEINFLYDTGRAEL